MLAVNMTITQIQQFVENNDASSVAFKRFNEHPIDVNPTFTFCLCGIDIYSETINELRMTKEQYYTLMKLGVNTSDDKSKHSRKILNLDHELFTKQFNMFIQSKLSAH